VAVATVRRLEGKRLHPRFENGVWLFDPVEVTKVVDQRSADAPVAKVRPASPGAVASAVFRLLDDGRSFREIVQLTEQRPAIVRALHREWRCGFKVPDHVEGDDEIERARDRDDRELRVWEQQMMELGRREDEYDLRSRDVRRPRTSSRQVALRERLRRLDE